MVWIERVVSFRVAVRGCPIYLSVEFSNVDIAEGSMVIPCVEASELGLRIDLLYRPVHVLTHFVTRKEARDRQEAYAASHTMFHGDVVPIRCRHSSQLT